MANDADDVWIFTWPPCLYQNPLRRYLEKFASPCCFASVGPATHGYFRGIAGGSLNPTVRAKLAVGCTQ